MKTIAGSKVITHPGSKVAKNPFEYFCKSCGQLRLSPIELKGAPGSLDVVSLKARQSCIKNPNVDFSEEL